MLSTGGEKSSSLNLIFNWGQGLQQSTASPK
jgi:hypothetical protein